MNYDDFADAVEDAQRTISYGDQAIQKLARMMKGRLQASGVDHWTLADLKKELQNFNAVTKEWKATP